MPAQRVFMSAAPTGTLYGACAGQRGLGNRTKSVVASTDGGESWCHPTGCSHRLALGTLTSTWCDTGFGAGYVRGIVAVSATTAFIYGDRLGIAKIGSGGAASYRTSMTDVTSSPRRSASLSARRQRGSRIYGTPTTAEALGPR